MIFVSYAQLTGLGSGAKMSNIIFGGVSMETLDFGSLSFAYTKTDYRYVTNYFGGHWDAGGMTRDADIILNESACVLHYCQACFEGMKAYRTKDGRVVCFRPELNEARMADSCRRMVMPVLPEGRFLEAVRQTVKANLSYLPPYGTGASLYLRPIMFGTTPLLGVKPAREFQFRLFASPVGPYFKGGVRALKLRICDFDRAAPRGTGHIKAGLNYAMSLYAITDAHENGYDENVYLDPATRTCIEETGGANLLFVSKDGHLVVPASTSILPSITRRSLVQVARDYLGLSVEERPVKLAEIGDFSECGLCGTAAVISPVGSIDDHGKVYTYVGCGPVISKLRQTLLGIQMGEIPAPDGWLMEID